MQMLAGASLVPIHRIRYTFFSRSSVILRCVHFGRKTHARMEFQKIRFKRPFLIGRFALNNGYTCIRNASRSPFTRPSFQITRDDESSRQHRSEDIWFSRRMLLEISITTMHSFFYEIRRVHGYALYNIITT